MQGKQKKLIKFFELEKLRKVYGLTQKQMAGLLGVCESSYNHKVNRVAPFDFEEMMIILNEFNKRAEKNGHKLHTLDSIFLG